MDIDYTTKIKHVSLRKYEVNIKMRITLHTICGFFRHFLFIFRRGCHFNFMTVGIHSGSIFYNNKKNDTNNIKKQDLHTKSNTNYKERIILI